MSQQKPTNNNKKTKTKNGAIATSKKKQSKQSNGNRKQNLVRIPVAYEVSSMPKRRTPQISNLADGCLRIKHKEYVTELTSTASAFQVILQLAVNPANANLFPWLSALASRFESYKFKSLKFVYQSESSTLSTGYMGIAFDSNTDDPAPTSKPQACAYKSVKRDNLWKAFTLPISSEELNKRKSYYNDTQGTAIGTAKQDLYYTGNVFIFSGTAAGSSTVGELWVEYDVEFMTPEIQLPSTLGSAISASPLSVTDQSGDPITNLIANNLTPQTALQNVLAFVPGAGASGIGALKALRAFQGLINLSSTGNLLNNNVMSPDTWHINGSSVTTAKVTPFEEMISTNPGSTVTTAAAFVNLNYGDILDFGSNANWGTWNPTMNKLKQLDMAVAGFPYSSAISFLSAKRMNSVMANIKKNQSFIKETTISKVDESLEESETCSRSEKEGEHILTINGKRIDLKSQYVTISH
jgi:hypothetical protein